ncbi:FG-GAP repeat domain-containing protein [Acidobacteriota bacterium]
MTISRFLVIAALLFIPVQESFSMCTPTVQWIWDGYAQTPGVSVPIGSPLVVQLTDDNMDGYIDLCDNPDVLITHTGAGGSIVTAFDGETGAAHFDFAVPIMANSGGVAAGDIDGDGIVEIVAVDSSGERFVAFEHTGSVKWTSQPVLDPTVIYGGPPGLADLDQDGEPEIYMAATVMKADGMFAWQGTAGRGAPLAYFVMISHAIDLDAGSPGLELLAGNTLYNAAGGIVWENPAVPDGYTAAGDLDGDGVPEILLATPAGIYLLNNHGNVLDGPMLPGVNARQPAMADVDGDGLPEAIIVTNTAISAMKWAVDHFETLWSQPTMDTSCCNGASAFDLNDDGAQDLIYGDEEYWYIFDGASGAVLHQAPYPSWTYLETPVIADIDHDGKTEILISAWQKNCSVTAYECDTAPQARSIWNQYQYHVTNVRNDGTIPQYEPDPWTGPNSSMAQVRFPANPYPIPPDLGNTLMACRTGVDVNMSWISTPGSSSFALFRGTAKGQWPVLPHQSNLPVPTVTLPDVPRPPDLYFYRVAGVNCIGDEGP